MKVVISPSPPLNFVGELKAAAKARDVSMSQIMLDTFPVYQQVQVHLTPGRLTIKLS
jgi:hypothetical protein